MAEKFDYPDQGRESQRPDHERRHSSSRRENELEEEDGYEFELLHLHEEQFNPERWAWGMAQKRKMPHAPRVRPDPGPEILKHNDDPGLYIGSDTQKVRVRASENPQPNGSFGFVGRPVAVEAEEAFLRGTLILRFDPRQLGSVVRHSLRLFYWDEQAQRFVLVTGSRVSLVGDYVFAPITRPGQYAIIGINADPLVLQTTRLICAIGALGVVLPGVARQLIDPICRVILCAPDLRHALEDPQVMEALRLEGAKYGLPVPMDGFGVLPDGGDLCDRCLGMGGLRLPECEIFDEPGLGPNPCVDIWESVGPANLSGCIKQVTIDPVDSNRLYCVAMNGGIWMLDGVNHYPSRTWRPLADQLDSLRMNAIAVASSDNSVLYAASPYVCMYRSDDRGGNWRTLEASRGWNVHKILVHPANVDTVYAATQTGFRVSTDGGLTWMLQRSGDILDAAFDPLDSSIIYIGIRSEGILKSFTSGFGPWTIVLPWSTATSPTSTEIKIALGYRHADGTLQADPNRTVVAKFSTEILVNGSGGRASGGGWVSRGSRGRTDQIWWDNVLAVDPFNPAVILTGEQELYRSPDGGLTWASVASYYAPHEDQQSVEFDRTNRGVVYLANDGGVYRSSDGGLTWYVGPISVADEIAARRSLVSGLATAEFYRVGVQHHTAMGNLFHSGIIAATNIASGLWQGIEGHAWEWNYVYADPKRVGRYYVFHGALGRRRFPGLGSDDFLNIGEFRPYTQSAWTSVPVGALAVDTRLGSNIILVGAYPDSATGAGYRLMMTTEGNREPRTLPDGSVTNQPTWTAVIDNGSDPVVSVMFARSELSKVYTMSSSGKVFRKDDIDAAGAWSEPGQWPVSGVRQMAVNSLHAERLYAVTGNQVGRSVDGGATWVEVGAGSLPTSEFNSVVAHPSVATRLYLGADIGVFVSDDEGDTWLRYDADLPNAEVLQIFWADDYLYAVTHGRGLWRRRPC